MEKIDVESILISLGIKYSSTRDSYKALCPFHDEDTPSWTIEQNEPYRYHCFGCGVKGNIFSLYYRLTKKSLYKELGIDLKTKEIKPTPFIKCNSNDSSIPTKEKKIFSIKGRFRDPIDNTEISKYLNDRRPGGVSKEFLRYYDIKYTLFMEINCPEKPRDSKDRGTFFVKRLTVPIKEGDKLLSIEGRSYCGDNKKVLYPRNSSSDTLFDINRLDFEQILLVTEGIFDLPGLFSLGYRNITAVMGASITPKQIELLNKFKEIWYFPDNDEPGEKVLSFLHEHLQKDFYVCRVDTSKDPGKASNEELQRAINNRIYYEEMTSVHLDDNDKKINNSDWFMLL